MFGISISQWLLSCHLELVVWVAILTLIKGMTGTERLHSLDIRALISIVVARSQYVYSSRASDEVLRVIALNSVKTNLPFIRLNTVCASPSCCPRGQQKRLTSFVDSS